MTLARRRGKVGAEQDRSEDAFTSDVLGPLRFLPIEDGLGPLLAAGRDERGQTPPAWWNPGPGSAFELVFWPRLKDKREPDCLLLTWEGPTCSGPPAAALVLEVKLGSDQHDIGGLSQLAHYLVEAREERPDDPAPPPE